MWINKQRNWKIIKKINKRGHRGNFKDKLPNSSVSKELISKFATQLAVSNFQYNFPGKHTEEFNLAELGIVLEYKKDTAEKMDNHIQ